MLIARRAYNSKNLFVISSHTENVKNTNSIIDVVYLEFYTGFNHSTKISMKISSTTLRAIAYAMKELFTTGTTSFSKINNPTNGEKKTLSFNVSSDSNYFINLTEGENKRHFQTDKYMFLAMAEDMKLMSDEIQKALYGLQQKNF